MKVLVSNDMHHPTITRVKEGLEVFFSSRLCGCLWMMCGGDSFLFDADRMICVNLR